MYYITQVLLPPLERVFNLVGADVRSWYDEMPKSLRVEQEDTISLSPRKQKEVMDDERSKIVDHFRSCHCLVCHSMTTEGEISTDLESSTTEGALDAKNCARAASGTHTRRSYLCQTG